MSTNQIGAGWSSQDPREVISKRARIVVLDGISVVFATVETKHCYSVSLERNNPDERKFVAEDEPWPGWFWARCPDRQMGDDR